MSKPRLSYEDSCLRLKEYTDGGVVPMPTQMPQYDDELLGVNFFKTFVGEGEDLSNLTIPRTYFGLSELNVVSFVNTDLTESNFCWNDFTEVDFTDAILAASDLRASKFLRVKFVNADLRGSDLRRSSFEACNFEGALLDNAILTHEQGKLLTLSEKQRKQVAWTADEGPEPDGG